MMFFFIGFPSLLIKKPKFGFFSMSKRRVLCNRSRREDSIGIKIVSNGANLASFWPLQSILLLTMGVYHNNNNDALAGGTGGSKMAKSSQKLTSLADVV